MPNWWSGAFEFLQNSTLDLRYVHLKMLSQKVALLPQFWDKLAIARPAEVQLTQVLFLQVEDSQLMIWGLITKTWSGLWQNTLVPGYNHPPIIRNWIHHSLIFCKALGNGQMLKLPVPFWKSPFQIPGQIYSRLSKIWICRASCENPVMVSHSVQL